MKLYLCLIIDRTTGETRKEYDDITARDSYYAKQQAAARYIEKTGLRNNWYADCLEIE